MFCPKCGSGDQSPESYCRACGGWLTDPDAGRTQGLFRATSREEKIRKIRTLEMVSVGLSLTSAAIIFAFLFGTMDRGLLFLALACGIVVAVYQAVNMYLGHKVTKTLPRQHSSERKGERDIPAVELPARATRQLSVPASVTDHTTEILDPALKPEKRSKES